MKAPTSISVWREGARAQLIEAGIEHEEALAEQEAIRAAGEEARKEAAVQASLTAALE